MSDLGSFFPIVQKICKIQGCVKNIYRVSFNYKLHCIITYSRQIFEFMLTKVEHVRVKHCVYALERIYLVFKHHSTREVIAVPRELKFIFNSHLGPKNFLKVYFISIRKSFKRE